MKGGANLEDQMAIRKAVLFSAESGNVLDVPGLAVSLDIPLDCCVSFVEFYKNKEGVTLPSKAAEKVKKGSAKAAAEGLEDGFFDR
jgi:hypothetical protein